MLYRTGDTAKSVAHAVCDVVQCAISVELLAAELLHFGKLFFGRLEVLHGEESGFGDLLATVRARAVFFAKAVWVLSCRFR